MLRLAFGKSRNDIKQRRFCESTKSKDRFCVFIIFRANRRISNKIRRIYQNLPQIMCYKF
ncbi:hypothetical protein ACWIUD_07095 [Helicobacter sp. 23-1044]